MPGSLVFFMSLGSFFKSHAIQRKVPCLSCISTDCRPLASAAVGCMAGTLGTALLFWPAGSGVVTAERACTAQMVWVWVGGWVGGGRGQRGGSREGVRQGRFKRGRKVREEGLRERE